MDRNKIAVVEINSWIGHDPDAVHFYGDLTCYDHGNYARVKLKRRLTQKGAIRYNKARRVTSLYRPGSTVEGFETRDDVINAAKKEMASRFPAAEILLRGSSSSASPQEMIVGPKQIIKSCNKIWERCEELGYYNDEKNYDEVDRISDEWNELINQALSQTGGIPNAEIATEPKR